MKKLIQGGLILIIAVIILTSCVTTNITQDQARERALSFINKTLVPPDEPVTIDDIIEQGDFYKLQVTFADGKQVISFMTKDGKKFFPQGYNIIEQTIPDQTDDGPDVAGVNITKSDKPTVELFVMSHCIYGTQLEKGLLPVLDTIAGSIDFKLKFCDYAMHDKEEIDEQLNQYCIQKNEPEKLKSYLECFLKDGDGAGCVQKIGINLVTLNQCAKSTDQEFKVTENYNDQSAWSGRYPPFNVYKEDNTRYGVQGSPTLVINAAQVSTGRSSAALLTTICSAFNTPPAACATELSSVTPAPGFGFAGVGSDADAQCE